MPTWITNFTEPNVLMGHFDDDDNKLGVLLGLWKPIHPEFVCDWPLAIMDARTFEPEHQLENRVHISFGIFIYHILQNKDGTTILFNPPVRFSYSTNTQRANGLRILILHSSTEIAQKIHNQDNLLR